MEATAIPGWSDFFIAAAGAAGALAGLVFVTLSINLARIIELPGVSGRAAETIILLGGALAGSLVALVPHLASRQLATLLFLVAGPTWVAPLVIQALSIQRHTYYRPWLAVLRAALLQVGALPGVIGCLALYDLVPGGIAWFAFGVVASMVVAMFNAWVLLVEILR